MALYELKAEISGVIRQLDAAVGDRVDLDGQVMIIESMKMEIPVLSPRRGLIRAFRAGEGDSVQEGQVLVTHEIE